MIRKRYFGLLEALLGLALILGGASGLKNMKQGKELRQTSEENKKQADRIDELVGDLQVANKKKDKIAQDLIDTEKKLKGDAKTGFSILLEQALDIYKETNTPFTTKHVETAKGYIHPDAWGYDETAKFFKWNMETIKRQQAETKVLMKKYKDLEDKYNQEVIDYEKKLGVAKGETAEHKLTANTLDERVKNFTSENNILFWVGIGLGIYFFCSLGGFSLLGHFKRKAQAQLKETKQAIKTFTDVNPDGNDTMNAIMKASKIDLEKD